MWVAPENVDPTLARPGIKPEAPSKPKLIDRFLPKRENTTGQSPLEKLKPGRLTDKERTKRFIEVMGEEPVRNRKVLETTFNTYSNVLANEFMAIYNAQQLKNAKLELWQETFLENVTHQLKKDNPNFDWEGADRDKRYSTFFSTFDKLLRSDDRDKAEQWMTTAMLSAKRQIYALQISTGAHVNVLREGDRVEHISDIRAMSVMISNESGKPVSEINEALGKFDRFLVGTTGSAFVDKLNVFRQIYLTDPTAIQRLQNDADVRALWKKYEVQARKRLYSSVRIDMNPGVFTTRDLDAAQQQYIRQLGHLSTAVDDQVLQKQARDDVEIYMTSLTKAQQDAYYVKFDKQLLTEDQLNLVKLSVTLNRPPRLVPSNPGVSPVRSTIEGVGNLNVGLGNPGELTTEFGRVMDAIKKDITREKLSSAVSGEIFRNVSDQISKLETEVSEKQLSEADQKRKEGLEGEIAKLDKKSEHIDAYEEARESWQAKQTELTNRENELRPLTDAQTELRTKEGDKATKQTELTNLESYQKTVRETREKLDKGDDQNTADTTRCKEINTDLGKLYTAIKGANSQDADIVSRMGRITQLGAELQEREDRIAKWTAERARLRGQYDAIIGGTSVIALTPEDLNSKIDTKRQEVKAVEEDVKELHARIAAGQEDLDSLQKLKQQVKTLEAQKNARAEELNRFYSTDPNIPITVQRIALPSGAPVGTLGTIDFAALDTALTTSKQTIEATKKTKQQDIDNIDTDLEIARLTDGRKKEVLESFRTHVLSSENWHQIFRRAREPKSNWDRVLDGTDQSFDTFSLAVQAKSEVPPAYLRMIQIVGGNMALEQTFDGKGLYKKISGFLTPDVFFDVMMKDPNRVAVLKDVYFGWKNGTLPADIGPFDPIMQSPEMRKAMMKFVDASFTEEVMTELLTRANTDKLGDLTDMEKQALPEISQRERQVTEQGMETERKQFDATRREAMRRTEWSGDQLKAHAVGLAKEYIKNLRLNEDNTPAAVRTANQVVKDRKIGTSFIINPFPIADEIAVRRQFKDAGIVIPAKVAPHRFINSLSRFNLDEEDFADELAIRNADAKVAKDILAIGLSLVNKDAIVDSIRAVLVQHDMPFDVSDALLATVVEPGVTLKEKLQTQINTVTNTGNITDDQMRDLVRDAGFVSEGTRAKSENLDAITLSFMERGGSTRDTIWINAVLSDLNAATVETVKNKLNTLGKKDRIHTLDELIRFLPDGDRERVTGKVRTFKEKMKERFAAFRGILVSTVNVDDETQVPDDYLFNETATYLDNIMTIVQGLPVQQVNSFVLDTKRRLKADQDLAGITKEAKYWSKTYWGLEGSDLVLALELALGGDAYRDEAIRLSREVEKIRASHFSK